MQFDSSAIPQHILQSKPGQAIREEWCWGLYPSGVRKDISRLIGWFRTGLHQPTKFIAICSHQRSLQRALVPVLSDTGNSPKTVHIHLQQLLAGQGLCFIMVLPRLVHLLNPTTFRKNRYYTPTYIVINSSLVSVNYHGWMQLQKKLESPKCRFGNSELIRYKNTRKCRIKTA